MDVVVVGAGIAGLVCALRLREAGCRVDVVAAEPPERTTSAVAAALWYPYRALPEREVTRWAAEAYTALAHLAGDPATGVALRTGRELCRTATPDPWWRAAVPTLDRLPAAELPPGYADGFRLRVPVVDPSVHLRWLTDALRERDVRFRYQIVTDLASAAPQADAVVNCTGLGARRLLGDDTLVPVRGQVVVVEQCGLTEWLVDDSDDDRPTYVVPRERTIVLGGTAETGSTDEVPHAGTAADVWERCVALVPALASAVVVGHRVGLRPVRPVVRLEVGRLASGQPVVHNYGHGGAGWTLSYGCADDVVRSVLATR